MFTLVLGSQLELHLWDPTKSHYDPKCPSRGLSSWKVIMNQHFLKSALWKLSSKDIKCKNLTRVSWPRMSCKSTNERISKAFSMLNGCSDTPRGRNRLSLSVHVFMKCLKTQTP
ncbi:hypothetical protein VULLAG_LOCUS19637 [Vulpes lagopus]